MQDKICQCGKCANGPHAPNSSGLCACGCGEITRIASRNDYRDETRKSEHVRFVHGHNAPGVTHGYSKSPEYAIWASMRQRCHNPNNRGFKYYGGRGVMVCDRWRNSFENFLSDMGERPEPKHLYSIHRSPDPYGNYEPSNCKWATWEEQSVLKRPRETGLRDREAASLTKFMVRMGGMLQKDVAKHLGVSESVISHVTTGKTWKYDDTRIGIIEAEA